jgi:hypothetical protein
LCISKSLIINNLRLWKISIADFGFKKEGILSER